MTPTTPTHVGGPAAYVISLFTFAVGQVVAFVPSEASHEQALISGGSTLISLGFMLANAAHHAASTRQQAAKMVKEAEQTATDRLRAQLRNQGIQPVA